MYVIGQEEIRAVEKVIKSGQMFRYRGGEGGFTDQFESALAKKIGVARAITTSSGTGALICAMVGLGIGPGDEVIVPAYTFIATPLAPLAVGAVPVIVDIDETGTIDPKAVERAVNRHTRAVIPVHMCGLPCNMEAIMKIAKRYKLLVCEDACQAVGGSYHGRRLTSVGHVGAFSFNQFKIICCGEGGALLTNNERIHQRALIYHDGGCVFRKHASQIKTEFFPGSNFRVSEIQGAIMMEQLKRLDGILARLRARKAIMIETLKEAARFIICPSNDLRGDCGTTLPVLFETADSARAFIESKKNLLGMDCPYDSGRHVYINWGPILKKQYHHPLLNPWRLSGRKFEYSHDMCARTLNILSRTVHIGVPYNYTLKQTRDLAKQLKG